MLRYVQSKLTPALACLVFAMASYILYGVYTAHEAVMAIERKSLGQKVAFVSANKIFSRPRKFRFQIEDRRNMFLTFVGGMPRSGTTLMRTMLDSHPLIRCGLETQVIQDMLNYHFYWTSDAASRKRLTEGGVYPEALDNAMAQFIIEIIIRHGPAAKYYCNKDPYTVMSTTYLNKLFPNSKHIMMVRDGRAFAHSVVTRGVLIKGYNITNYRQVMEKWNFEISLMHANCLAVGKEICLPVKYEHLVLRPVSITKRIFKFLKIPWNEVVLHHEDHLNETQLSDSEYSTSQVVKPLNLDALSSWHGKLPGDVVRDMPAIAPMLRILGYDPSNRAPDYGQPDDFVRNRIEKQRKSERQLSLQ